MQNTDSISALCIFNYLLPSVNRVDLMLDRRPLYFSRQRRNGDGHVQQRVYGTHQHRLNLSQQFHFYALTFDEQHDNRIEIQCKQISRYGQAQPPDKTFCLPRLRISDR